MPEDRRLTISSSSRVSPDEVARRTFATARRGFDPAEVRAYLELVARELLASAEREEQWRDELDAAEHRASNPVLDDNTLTAALGQETARVLRSAHDAAAELVARAEADSLRLRTHAQDEAEQVQARAEQIATDRSSQAEAAVSDLWRRAKEEAEGRVESARLEAESLVAQAANEGRAMVQEAQELRARVLGDLNRRRRVLHSQIEQLRAGRERLAETISEVRHSVDRITDELFRAEDEARLAAEAAGRQVATQDDFDELERPLDDAHSAVGTESGTEDVTGADGDADGAHDGDGGDGAAGSGEDPAASQAVEDLFARLRAERVGQGQSAEPIQLTAGGPDAGGPDDGSTGAEAEAGAATGSVEDPASASPDETDASGEGDPSGEATEAGDPSLTRRTELMASALTVLNRRLKRALQDDQNDVLARIRAGKGWGPGVLPSDEDHMARYVKAALDPLSDAARAGVVFAGGDEDPPPVTDLAQELATAIVTTLRRRLEDGSAAVDSGDDAALVDSVGAAYREWKGARLERLAGDQAVAAFSLAVLSSSAPVVELRWVVDDDGVQCPDCDDNALAGPLRRGEEFPTGHTHPPAHAGCRCLVVPANA